LNQKELAEHMGVRESTLSRYENDKRTYQWDGLVKLADALDTNVDYLLGRTSVSETINRIVFEEAHADGEAPFLEAYRNLDPDDRNLLLERALTLYDVRNRDKEKNK
jgi:transcriptional regulator with XRE-family HTH domain